MLPAIHEMSVCVYPHTQTKATKWKVLDMFSFIKHIVP